jgi:hypothetical protein
MIRSATCCRRVPAAGTRYQVFPKLGPCGLGFTWLLQTPCIPTPDVAPDVSPAPPDGDTVHGRYGADENWEKNRTTPYGTTVQYVRNYGVLTVQKVRIREIRLDHSPGHGCCQEIYSTYGRVQY